MAIRTYQVGTLDNGNVAWSVDWDDVSLFLTLLRCVNNSAFGSRLTGTATATGRSGSLFCPAHTTQTQNLPTQAQNRLDISFDPAKNRIDGVTYSIGWPSS